MEIKLRDWNPHKKTQKIINIILELVAQYTIPLTVRQVHYKLVETPEANHPNTINGYQKASRILTKMRYAGLLDWEKIVDETRDTYKTISYKNIKEAEKNLLKKYRRDRWKDNEYYLEVWVEKRTLIRQFFEITDKYDVRLASGGGFSSATYIKDAMLRLYPKKDKKIIIFYFGDLDPSGDFMNEDIENRFAEWGIELDIFRVALNEEHLDKYKLQKKFDVKVKKGNKIYNKIKEDPRAKRFYDKYGELFQVELEALDPNVLNQMLDYSILCYADLKQQDRVKLVEKKEVKDIKKKLNLKEAKGDDTEKRG